MKISNENLLLSVQDEIVFIPTLDADPGCEETNMLNDNTLHIWKVTEGDIEIVLSWDTGFSADFILLSNVNFQTNVTYYLYDIYPTNYFESGSFTPANIKGFDNPYLYIPIIDRTTEIKAIKLIFTGNDSTFQTHIGNIWVGNLIDLGCAEKIQPIDTSEDQVTITRTNRPDTNREYNYQSYQVTLDKNTLFQILRDKFRGFWIDAYTKTRPFLIDETFLNNPEMFLGIFDAGKIPYDLFPTTEDWYGQITIGIREVF